MVNRWDDLEDSERPPRPRRTSRLGLAASAVFIFLLAIGAGFRHAWVGFGLGILLCVAILSVSILRRRQTGEWLKPVTEEGKRQIRKTAGPSEDDPWS